jgi:hypothetical protein
MNLAALALAMLLIGPQVAKEPVHQPDRVREGCGYLTGANTLIPIEVGLFFEGDPPFADAYGQAIRVGTRWMHPDQAPYPTGASRSWFRDGDPITFEGRRYVKHGLPRVYALDELELVGEHDGLAVLTGGLLPGQSEPTLFLLSEPASCGFQPYRAG